MTGFQPTSFQHPAGDLKMKEAVESHLRHRIERNLPGPSAFVIGRARTAIAAERMPQLAWDFDPAKPEVSFLILQTANEPLITDFVAGASDVIWRTGATEVCFCCQSWRIPRSESKHASMTADEMRLQRGFSCWAAMYVDRNGGVDGLLLHYNDRKITDHSPWGEVGAATIEGRTLATLKRTLANVQKDEAELGLTSMARH